MKQEIKYQTMADSKSKQKRSDTYWASCPVTVEELDRDRQAVSIGADGIESDEEFGDKRGTA